MPRANEKTAESAALLETPTIPETPHASIGNALEVRVLDDLADVAGIEPAWRELVCAEESSAPFLQPAWIKAWWQVFGEHGQLRVVTVWSGSRLVGLLPLMLSRERRYGMSVRRLGALANDHSPRVDLLIAPDVEGVTTAIWRHVAGTGEEWDIFELPRLRSGSPTLHHLSELARADGVRFGLWQAEVSPVICLRTTWSSYLADRSSSFKKDIRRKWRRLVKLGHPALEIVAEPSAVAAALEVAFEIEADGWKGKAGTAMQSVAEVRQFYEQMARGMAEQQMLRLHFLTLDGERIAFDLAIKVDRKLYSLKSGFKYQHAATSPGLLLLYLIVQHYLAEGHEEIDLLGEDDAFKRHWTRSVRSHHWFICFSRSPRARAIELIKFQIASGVKKMHARFLEFVR